MVLNIAAVMQNCKCFGYLVINLSFLSLSLALKMGSSFFTSHCVSVVRTESLSCKACHIHTNRLRNTQTDKHQHLSIQKDRSEGAGKYLGFLNRALEVHV